MRLPVLAVVVLLSACANRTAKDVDMAGVEPLCARQCLAQNADCVGQSSRAFGIDSQARLLNACTDNLEACRSTCPPK
jgi:hypothetical protein